MTSISNIHEQKIREEEGNQKGRQNKIKYEVLLTMMIFWELLNNKKIPPT